MNVIILSYRTQHRTPTIFIQEKKSIIEFIFIREYRILFKCHLNFYSVNK